jgi:hypothetical protein
VLFAFQCYQQSRPSLMTFGVLFALQSFITNFTDTKCRPYGPTSALAFRARHEEPKNKQFSLLVFFQSDPIYHCANSAVERSSSRSASAPATEIVHSSFVIDAIYFVQSGKSVFCLRLFACRRSFCFLNVPYRATVDMLLLHQIHLKHLQNLAEPEPILSALCSLPGLLAEARRD